MKRRVASRPHAMTEPKGPIDPKSVEAAGQVVQSYGALIEQKRWTEANALWGNRQRRRRNSNAELAQLAEVHLEIGDLGDTGRRCGFDLRYRCR